MEGFAIAKLTGQDYGWKDAAVDAALGAVGAGLADKLNDIRKAAKGIDRAADGSKASGVVYRRTDLKTGEQYIGRSRNEATYLNRQARHDWALGTKHKYEVIGRADGNNLRVAEESAIRKHGGPTKLANKRYEMNDEAYRAAGGTVPKP